MSYTLLELLIVMFKNLSKTHIIENTKANIAMLHTLDEDN